MLERKAPRTQRVWTPLLLCLICLMPAFAAAQIIIGQTAAFSGIPASSVAEISSGAQLYLDHVNTGGGIGGQRINLIQIDDKFEPARAAANARTLIVERKAIALFLSRGTPHTEAILPVLEQYRVPLVAPSTGALSLHRPVNPWVFNVRSTYQREAEKAVEHLTTIGLTRIALVQVDDSFGADAAAGAMRAFARTQVKPLFSAKFDRVKPNFQPIAEQTAQQQAQAVLFFGSVTSVAEGVQAIRALGSKAQIVTLSNNAAAGFVKALGDNAYGTIVTQVFPNERAMGIPFIKEATDLAHAKGIADLTPAMLEGFAAAKVLVEALRRAGSKPTSLSLTAALNSMSNFDLGGLELSYSPTDHSGLNGAEMSMIGKDGRFMR